MFLLAKKQGTRKYTTMELLNFLKVENRIDRKFDGIQGMFCHFVTEEHVIVSAQDLRAFNSLGSICKLLGKSVGRLWMFQ